MITSMTGFGRAEVVCGNNRWVIELKSLNHRFLEVYIRLPNAVSLLELNIKKKISDRLSRGRVEVTIRVDSGQSEAPEPELEWNRPLLRRYYNLLNELKHEFPVTGDITLGMMAGLKDAIIASEKGIDPGVVWESLEKGVEEALEGLIQMRQKEGESLYEDLQMRVQAISGAMATIKARAPQVVMEYQKRLTDRVKELMSGLPMDEARLAQEVAIMADRSDITEEIVRFASHTDQWHEMMQEGEPVGRKLDFLLQEMNREINTIGSKTGDNEISRLVVEVKAELSRLKEQVQNIE